MSSSKDMTSQRTWIFEAEVKGYYVPAKPLVIGDFELKTVEDKEKGTRFVAQLSVKAKDLHSAGELARQEFSRVFKAIMLSVQREYEFEIRNATEITPDRQFEQEHMGYETITFPFVGVLNPEDVDQLRDKTEEVLRLMGKTDSFSQKAIEYFMIGASLSRWPQEAFLPFFKAIELISGRFRRKFETAIKTQIPDLEPDEISRLATSKRKILNACKILGLENVNEKVNTIVRTRNRFDIAHATLEREFKKEYADECRELAGEIILNYMRFLQDDCSESFKGKH